MTITFCCSGCDRTATCALSNEEGTVTCSHCGRVTPYPENAFVDHKLTRCLVCPSTDLFIRKDFPQRVGVVIVVIGFAASCIAWFYYQVVLTFAILFATALVDLSLFALMGGVVVCYRCSAHYRGVPVADQHGTFELETHERHRQQVARLAERRAASY